LDADHTKLDGIETGATADQTKADIDALGINADKVDACDAGVATGNVFKIPGAISQGDVFFVDVSGNILRLAAGTSGHFLKTQGAGANPVWAAGAAGVTTWLQLNDTPGSFTGNAQKIPKVNAVEDALEFIAQGAGGGFNADQVDGSHASAFVTKALYDAYSILYADTDNTPAALPVAGSRIIGRKATGGIAALTVAEAKTLLAIAIADISDIPGTIASILTDHDKARHDALNINADQIDGKDASDLAPSNAVYLVKTTHADLTAERATELRVVTPGTGSDIQAQINDLPI